MERFRQKLRDAGLVVREFTTLDGLELEVFHALRDLPGVRRPGTSAQPVTGPALDGRGPGPGMAGLAGVADQLAAAVGSQWQQEAAALRLNDPFPLPVRWVPADPSLVDDWQTVVMLAESGAGRRDAERAGRPGRAGEPGELAGEGAELAGMLPRVPAGRLVVLGEPGSGKTVLMIRLVLDLLARRDSGGPVPVLVSIASWNPAEQGLRGWLEVQLSLGYPWLAAPAPRGHRKVSRVRALLDNGLIMPVLDGLDEIPAEVSGRAVAAINDAARPGERLVVTSRTAQWQQAVSPPGGTEVRLRGAAGIMLRPLDADVVAGYLRADAGGPAAEARWDTVLAALPTRPKLAQVLSSPLMTGLARVVYNPRPGEHPAALPDPAELCDTPDVRAHLLAAYIPAAYRGSRRGFAGRRPVSPRQAGKWLTFLARHLEHTVKTPDIAWWQLARALPRFWPDTLLLSFAGLSGSALAALARVPLAGAGEFQAITRCGTSRSGVTGSRHMASPGPECGAWFCPGSRRWRRWARRWRPCYLSSAPRISGSSCMPR